MLRQVDGSVYYWPEIIGDGVAALMRWAKWTCRLPSRIIMVRRNRRRTRQAQVENLIRKIRQLEGERQSLVELCEQLIDERDHNYHLYLHAMRATTAA